MRRSDGWSGAKAASWLTLFCTINLTPPTRRFAPRPALRFAHRRVGPNKEKNPDFNTKATSAPAPAPAPQATADASKEQNAFQEQTVIPNLASYVQINPSITLFNSNPTLKRIVPVAVDRAIREIIQPVVERSVTIACITAKEVRRSEERRRRT